MNKTSRFDKETMAEIGRVRESLKAYKDKIQPYPALKEESTPIIQKETVYLENLTDGKFLQLQALVHSLQEKVERITTDKKKRYKEYNI